MQLVFSWAPKLARKCAGKHWLPCGTEVYLAMGLRPRTGRAPLLCYVIWAKSDPSFYTEWVLFSQWLPLTRAPQRFLSSGSNLHFGGHQSTVTVIFHALAQSRFFHRFSSTRKNISAFKPFLQYFATGSGTVSCQDYKEYEFVECLSEEIKIIDLCTL